MRGDSNEVRRLSSDVMLKVDRVDGGVGEGMISSECFLTVLTLIQRTDFLLSNVHVISLVCGCVV